MLYSWNLRKWGDRDVPEWNACLGLSFDLFANFCSVLILIDFYGPFAAPIPGRGLVLVSFVFLVSIHYLHFIRKKRFLTLESEFSSAMEIRSWARPVAWAYVIGSPILFFILGFLGATARAA